MVTKLCIRCGGEFSKGKKISRKQWDNRLYCGNVCKAIKRTVSDEFIVDKYKSGITAKDVGLLVGLSGTHITRILHNNKVEIRDISESISIGLSKPEVRRKMSILKTGVPLSESAKQKLRMLYGPKRSTWKGGITKNKSGYIAYTKSKENKEKAGRYVHRVVVEDRLGYRLPSNMHVHHKDKNKTNNALSNLEVMDASDHMKHHHACGDITNWRSKC